MRMLCTSIILRESQRDVRARPYFRGRAVCSRADIGTGSVLTSPPRMSGVPAGTGETWLLRGMATVRTRAGLQIPVRAGSP
jgi:hypothetical protein